MGKKPLVIFLKLLYTKCIRKHLSFFEISKQKAYYRGQQTADRIFKCAVVSHSCTYFTVVECHLSNVKRQEGTAHIPPRCFFQSVFSSGIPRREERREEWDRRRGERLIKDRAFKRGFHRCLYIPRSWRPLLSLTIWYFHPTYFLLTM